MILHPDRDRYPKISPRPSLEMILCSLPSLGVSGFVGVCLSTDYFNQFKVK